MGLVHNETIYKYRCMFTLFEMGLAQDWTIWILIKALQQTPLQLSLFNLKHIFQTVKVYWETTFRHLLYFLCLKQLLVLLNTNWHCSTWTLHGLTWSRHGLTWLCQLNQVRTYIQSIFLSSSTLSRMQRNSRQCQHLYCALILTETKSVSLNTRNFRSIRF